MTKEEGAQGLSPGVLTPGTDKKGTRPEGGGREAFSVLECRTRSSTDFLSPLSSFRSLLPELRRTSRAGLYCQFVLGLKPQAQSYSPFGTKKSIRSKYLSTFPNPPPPHVRARAQLVRRSHAL